MDKSKVSPFIIEITDLKKRFKNKKVLKGINLKIPRNQTLAIIGPNGSGKTTLVDIIVGTSKQNSGKVKYNFMSTKDKNVSKHIGVQFQEGNWPAKLSAHDILHFYTGIYAQVTKARVEELKKVFEIEEFIKRDLDKVSGGQKQRFNALLAVLHNPELIVFDELTTGLDIQLQYKILNYVKSLMEEKTPHTIIMVSHSPEEIEARGDRVVVIGNIGKIWVNYSVKEAVQKFGSIRKMMNLYFEGKLYSNIEELKNIKPTPITSSNIPDMGEPKKKLKKFTQAKAKPVKKIKQTNHKEARA